MRLAAGAEMLSSHPLATAIVDYARTHELDPIAPTTFQTRPGRGVVASVSGRSRYRRQSLPFGRTSNCRGGPTPCPSIAIPGVDLPHCRH